MTVLALPTWFLSWLVDRFTPRDPRDYLTPGERCVLTTRRHWIVPLREISRGLGVMTVVSFFLIVVPGLTLFQVLLGAGAVAHAGYIAWCVLTWRLERIVVTDRRLGLIENQVWFPAAAQAAEHVQLILSLGLGGGS